MNSSLARVYPNCGRPTRKVWATILFLVGLLVVAHTPGVAQIPPQCTNVRINAKGTNGAAITVSTTPVTIADANTSRCELRIFPEGATNTVRCAATTGPYPLTPSATVGALLPITPATVLGLEAQQTWQCVRAGGADALLTVIEALP